MTDRAHLRTATAPDPERAAAVPPAPSPVAEVIALQRSAGNAAVSRAMLARDPLVEAPGAEYEYKVEHKGERASWSIRFSALSSHTALKGKADFRDPGASAGDMSAQLLPAKMTAAHTRGRGFGRSMAAALMKADLTVAEIAPGLTIAADFKALEAKLEAGDIDVNAAKLGVQLQGTLSPDIAGTEIGDAILASDFGPLIRGGMQIKVQGRFELSVDPADLGRLRRMVQLNRELAEAARRAAELKGELDGLEARNAEIRRELGQRDLDKRLRRRLDGELRSNAAEAKRLRRHLGRSRAQMEGLQRAIAAAAEGLKTKAGRTLGLAVRKAGGAVLKRVVPGLNIAFAVLDVIEVSVAIGKLIDGAARFGLPGDAEGGADAGTPYADELPGGVPAGSSRIRYVTEPGYAGTSVTEVQFAVLGGLDAATRPGPEPRDITIAFEHEGVQRTITFLVVVKSAEAEGDATTIVAANHRTWEIEGTGLHLHAGEELTVVFAR